jgi:hypothetical protein
MVRRRHAASILLPSAGSSTASKCMMNTVTRFTAAAIPDKISVEPRFNLKTEDRPSRMLGLFSF